MFLFPSTGTAFLNEIGQNFIGLIRSVSIPFQREGVSEHSIGAAIDATLLSFYSLQPGRRF